MGHGGSHCFADPFAKYRIIRGFRLMCLIGRAGCGVYVARNVPDGDHIRVTTGQMILLSRESCCSMNKGEVEAQITLPLIPVKEEW